jgi:hypothetical protein
VGIFDSTNRSEAETLLGQIVSEWPDKVRAYFIKNRKDAVLLDCQTIESRKLAGLEKLDGVIGGPDTQKNEGYHTGVDRRLASPGIQKFDGHLEWMCVTAENIFDDQLNVLTNARCGDNPQFPLKPEYIHLRLTPNQRMELKEMAPKLRAQAMEKLSSITLADFYGPDGKLGSAKANELNNTQIACAARRVVTGTSSENVVNQASLVQALPAEVNAYNEFKLTHVFVNTRSNMLAIHGNQAEVDNLMYRAWHCLFLSVDRGAVTPIPTRVLRHAQNCRNRMAKARK